MQKLVFPMRETMPYFVCSLRQVDEWKRFRARNSQIFTNAEYDVNAKYIKSPFAQSLKIEDLLRFLDDTAIDMEFMVQLPSIEKCLEQWWKMYAKHQTLLEPEQFRQVYYDLANVLVQAKTETIHKNSVSMIMRAAWTKWSMKEPPLSNPEFYRLLFMLAHLMTESNRLDDYVTFFHETLAKITRVYQSKAKRIEQRKRKPRMHRKSSLVEIMGSSGVIRMSMSGARTMSMMSNQGGGGCDIDMASSGYGATENGGGNVSSGSVDHGTVNVTLQRVINRQSSGISAHELFGDGTADRFVEVLDRRGVYAGSGMAQHVVVDPLLLEKRFQDKWRRPAHAEMTQSTDDTLRELHPLTNKYVPPLSIARLHTSPLPPSGPGLRGLLQNRQCQSTPSLKLKAVDGDCDRRTLAPVVRFERDDREDDVLRRSLSMVTLKKRMEKNKSDGKKNNHRKEERRRNDNGDDAKGKTIDLAIST